MSKPNNPVCQDKQIDRTICNQLAELSYDEIEEKIDRFLCEAMDACKDYIAREIRDTYCRSRKLAILPSGLINPIKEKTDEIFLTRFSLFSTQVLKQQEHIRDT